MAASTGAPLTVSRVGSVLGSVMEFLLPARRRW